MPPLVDQLVGRLNEAAMLMFPFAASSAGPDYEPAMNTSFFARAQQRRSSALAEIYDYLAEGDGTNLIYFPIFNYLGGSLDTVHTMLTHPQALVALSDAGAHVGTVCDASLPTTLLAHWARDRSRGARLDPAQAVAMLTSRNARHLGLVDRGQIAVGMRADINVIDFSNLAAAMPEMVRDLPAGGKRFVQKARGYVATLCKGELVCANAAISAARPGRLVRAAIPVAA
jgi:N-acyl-D-aspartate/D-glutamate deacylase